jgi:hypothetical protein
MNAYAIIAKGSEYIVTKNGNVIVFPANRKAKTFATIEKAQAFVAPHVAADDRHAMHYGK